ncbi:MAG: lanthionine synthetase LanC family protein [Pseudomonadota bacterium]
MQAEQLLDVANRVHHWLERYRIDTQHGCAWGVAAERPDKALPTLYAGGAGIALMYLELAEVLQESAHIRLAAAAADQILSQRNDFAPTCAPMGGWAGYMFVFNELMLRTKELRFRDAAHECAQRQRDSAEQIGNGIGWIQEMPYAKLTGHAGVREIHDMSEGAAGAGTYWLYADEHNIHPSALQWSVQVADRLLEVAEPAPGGLRWQLMPDIPWPFDAPNFAHGTAGVAYFFARMYERAREHKYLAAALAGAGHVQAVAEQMPGGGHLVPHVLNDGRPNRFYLGICHGPPGTARLFYLLHKLTGDAEWQAWSRDLDTGLISLGAPEKRGRGYWNNVSQCCCDAGIGEHAINLFRATGDQFYLDLAQRVAAELLRRAEVVGDGLCWPQAEHRTQPDFVQRQTGYMQGAAGVASFFIHLGSTLMGQPVKIQFPDSPYL